MLFKRPAITLLVFLTLNTSATMGSGWDDYKPNTIASMEAEFTTNTLRPIKNGQYADYYFTPGLPFKSMVVYLGEKRDISAKRNNFIYMWVKTHKLGKKLAYAYKKEIKVSEGNIVYWIPVQNVLIAYLDKEVKKNNKVVLYMVLAGAAKQDLVFLVNELNL